MTEELWYYAQLRWAVMVEGKQEWQLREWIEADYVFRSPDDQAAFEQALEIGYKQQWCHTEGRQEVVTRLTEVVRLGCLISNPTHFEVARRTSRAKEKLPFDPIFRPEESVPKPLF
jgi:hypothetical protein